MIMTLAILWKSEVFVYSLLCWLYVKTIFGGFIIEVKI